MRRDSRNDRALTARERAAEAGAAALRPVASARLRASVLRQSGAPTPLARTDCCSKVDFVEAQCGSRCEHELVTAMYETGGLERCQRVHGLHPTTDLRDQLV
jgi:hypothetical protein